MATRKKVRKIVEIVKKEIPQDFLEGWKKINPDTGGITKGKSKKVTPRVY